MKRWLQEKLTKKPLHRGDITKDIATRPRTSRKLSDDIEVRTSSSIDQQGQAPTICDLPDDILLLILRYLSPADETFYSFRRVCRRFRNVSCQLSHYGHRSTIKIGPEDTISFKLFTTLMKEFANHIQTVDFSGCDDVTDQVIHTVAKTCRHLKQLYLTGCGQLTNVGLKVIARYLNELESLDVSLCPWITASGIFLVVTSVGRSLKKLHMNNCLGMRSCGLIAFSLGKYCPKLTHLTLAWTPEFGLQPPAVQLNLIKFSTRCHRLEYMDISYNECQTMDLAQLEHNCPRLKHLKAHHVFKDNSLTSLRNGFLQLTRLDLTDNWRLADRGLSLIVEHCPLLMELILTRCYDLRGRGIVLTISSCENLRSLKVNFCFYMDEKALEWVGTMSKSLTHMDVSHNVNISPITLRNISEVRKSHKRAPVEIITGGCPKITRSSSRFK